MHVSVHCNYMHNNTLRKWWIDLHLLCKHIGVETNMGWRQIKSPMIQKRPLQSTGITVLNHLHQPSPQQIHFLWNCLKDCKFDKIWPSNCIFPKQRRKIRCTSSGGSSKIVWRGPGFCRTSVATDVSMDNLRRAITPRYPLKLLLTRSHNTRWCYKKIVNLWARMPLRL